MINDPAVLDLRLAIELAQNAVDGNSIASNRLGVHTIVANSAVSIVGAVNGQGVTVGILNVHIAILSIVNLSNYTSNLELNLSIGVVVHQSTVGQSLLNGDGCAIGSGQLRNIFTGLSRDLVVPRSGVSLVASDGSSQLEVDSFLTADDLNSNSAVAVVNDLNSGVVSGPLNLNLLALNGVNISAGEVFGNGGSTRGGGISRLQFFECLLLFADLGLLQGCQVSNEVGLAQSRSVLTGNLSDIGSAHGLVVAVCTQIEGSSGAINIQLDSEGLDISIPLQGLGGLSGEDDVVVVLAGGIGELSQNFDIVLLAALHEVQAIAAGNGLNKDVNSFGVIRGGLEVETVHIAGQVQVLIQRLLEQEELVCSTSLRSGNDLGDHGGGGDVLICGRNIRAGILPAVQSTTLSKLNGIVVVHQVTGNGDRITNTDLIGAIACQTVGLDGLAIDLQNDGNVLVAGIVRSLDLGDLAGQSCLVRQGLAVLQSEGILDDLSRIGRSGDLRSSLLNIDQLASLYELDLACIVGNVTLNGDGIANQQVVCAFTGNTVAQHGILGMTVNNDGNRNVAICGVVNGIDGGNLTGQGSNVRQRLAIFQSICVLQDLQCITGSINSLTLNNIVQSTTGVKFDLAVVVLQNTGNGNGVADLQISSAVALQAVALNGLAFSTGNLDGNSDVAIALIVCSVDADDSTSQGNCVVKCLAGLQLVCFLNDCSHIVVNHGQQVVPAVGNTVSAVGNGCSQNVRNVHCGLLIDVDGNHTIFALDDLNVLFRNVNGPNDLVILAIDRHNADTLEVARCLFAGILVNRLDICKSGIQVSLGVNSTCGRLCCGTLIIQIEESSGANAQEQCHYQGPNDYLLVHSLLLLILMDCYIIRGEHFDLVSSIVVVHNTLNINGLTFVNVSLDHVSILANQHGGTNVNILTVNHTGQRECTLRGAAFCIGSVGVHNLQALHFNGGAHCHCSVFINCLVALIIDGGNLTVQESVCSRFKERRLISFADLLDVAGIIRLHHTVVQVRNLISTAGFVVLNRANNADFIAHTQDFHTLTVQIIAVVNRHTIVHICFSVVCFHINAVAVINSDNAVESDLHIGILLNIGAQLLQGQLNCITIVEIGVLLAGVDIQLLSLCLCNRSHTGCAVLIVGRIAGDCQTVLQQFNIQIAVFAVFLGFVPNPSQIAVTGGICFPCSSFAFQHDRNSIRKLFLRKVGCFLAIFFDLAGGFRSVDRQITALQDAACNHGRRNMEMGCIAINELLDRSFLLDGCGVHIQLYRRSIVNDFCNCRSRRFGRLCSCRIFCCRLPTAGHQAGYEDQSQT